MFNIQNPRHSIIAKQVLEWTFHDVPPANKIIVGKQTNFDNYAEVFNAILENDSWRTTNVNSVPQWITDNTGNPLRPCGHALNMGVYNFIHSHADFGKVLLEAIQPISSRLVLMED